MNRIRQFICLVQAYILEWRSGPPLRERRMNDKFAKLAEYFPLDVSVRFVYPYHRAKFVFNGCLAITVDHMPVMYFEYEKGKLRLVGMPNQASGIDWKYYLGKYMERNSMVEPTFTFSQFKDYIDMVAYEYEKFLAV